MLWNEWWEAQKGRVTALDTFQRFRLCTGVVDRAMWRLSPFLSKSKEKGRVPLAREALELLWIASTNKETFGRLRPKLKMMFRKVLSTIPDEDSSDVLDNTWDALLWALVHSLGCAFKENSETRCLDAASTAYQAVWFRQIYPKMVYPRAHYPSSQNMEEVVFGMQKAWLDLERENRICTDDLKFQLECLDRVEAGQNLQPMRPR